MELLRSKYVNQLIIVLVS